MYSKRYSSFTFGYANSKPLLMRASFGFPDVLCSDG